MSESLKRYIKTLEKETSDLQHFLILLEHTAAAAAAEKDEVAATDEVAAAMDARIKSLEDRHAQDLAAMDARMKALEEKPVLDCAYASDFENLYNRKVFFPYTPIKPHSPQGPPQSSPQASSQ